MDTLNVQYFYGLGFALGRLQSVAYCDERLNKSSWSTSLDGAIQWAKSCSMMDLEVMPKTKKAASDLLEVLENSSILLGQNRQATAQECNTISDAITAFYHVFEQEVEDINCYIITPVGAYAVSALLKNASSHLSAGAQKVVSKEVKKDFNKAGECLALDLYTACGFHAMRAVEAEACIYQREVTGVDLADVPLGTLIYGDNKTSGLRTQYINEGSKHDSPLGLAVSLLLQLNHIYRIPVMHPKMQLSANKAKFVFDTAAIAISAMVEDAVTRFTEKEKAAAKASQVTGVQTAQP
jgi:hypothetical protein